MSGDLIRTGWCTENRNHVRVTTETFTVPLGANGTGTITIWFTVAGTNQGFPVATKNVSVTNGKVTITPDGPGGGV